MGGALVLTCGASLPIHGIVAFSTPYRIPPSPRLSGLSSVLSLLKPFSLILRSIPKPHPFDYHNPRAVETHLGYSVIPTRAIPEINKLLDQMRGGLPNLDCPTLLIHSRNDMVVPPSNALALFEKIGCAQKDLFWVERSGHVIPLEPDRLKALDKIEKFIAHHTGAHA
jgi:carboxylesterase